MSECVCVCVCGYSTSVAPRAAPRARASPAHAAALAILEYLQVGALSAVMAWANGVSPPDSGDEPMAIGSTEKEMDDVRSRHDAAALQPERRLLFSQCPPTPQTSQRSSQYPCPAPHDRRAVQHGHARTCQPCHCPCPCPCGCSASCDRFSSEARPCPHEPGLAPHEPGLGPENGRSVAAALRTALGPLLTA